MFSKKDLPDINDIVYAISETPLGAGAEARVFKIHTKPDFTLRVSLQIKDETEAVEHIHMSRLQIQPDIFQGRNYAQTVAYFVPRDSIGSTQPPLITINRYSPGFSIDVDKNLNNNFSSRNESENETNYFALKRTIALSEQIADLGENAIDRLYDDLHFLNSVKHSIDCGAGGPFVNTGNILYSAKDKEVYPIDLQPFITENPGINMKHTKGQNSPLYISRGLLPGSYKYQYQHSTSSQLIKLRTEILHNIVNGAERNHLSDINNYSTTNKQSLASIWRTQFDKLNIPEKDSNEMLFKLLNIKDEPRYLDPQTPSFDITNYKRVAGMGME